VSAPPFEDGGVLTVAELDGNVSTTERFRRTSAGSCREPALVSGDGRWCARPAPGNGLLLHAAGGGPSADVLLDTELTTDGAVPTAGLVSAAMSSSARFVAFGSAATNLVAGDTNGTADLFVVDRDPDGDGVFDEGTSLPVQRVSVAGGGGDNPDGASGAPALSHDGRYVVFVSESTNLVAGDTNGVADVFRYDRSTGRTERVSVANGAGAQANGSSAAPAIDADAGTVAFVSHASNLVGNDTNGVSDVFRRQLDAGATTTTPTPGPAPG
jgi:hypothetical protein